MEDFTKRVAFKELLYKNLVAVLNNYSFKLTYDNRKDDGDRKRIFRLVFQGKRTVEVFNDDWRDYTEYFRIKIDDQEVKVLNVDQYKDINKAFKDLVAIAIKFGEASRFDSK